jgi:hypothetical protein
MVDFLGKSATKRKTNLFEAACFRRIWHLLPVAECREAVEVLEQYAEGNASLQDLENAQKEAWDGILRTDWDKMPGTEGEISAMKQATSAITWGSLDMVMGVAEATAWVKVNTPEAISEPEERAQCDLVRDIFGNPFRPVTLDPAWLTPKVKTLAQAIYNNRAFERLPELADALAEAGCSNPDILSHCRGPGPHVRGCWVVDLVLGKE